MFRSLWRTAAAIVLAAGLAGAPPALAAERKIELLEPGSGARRVLRYTPTPGQTQVARVSLDLSTRMEIMGTPMTLDLPTMVTTVAATVTGVEEAGDITYDYAVRDITIGNAQTPEPIAAPMRDQVRSLVGTRATVRLSTRGEIRSSTYAIPDTAPPDVLVQLQKSLREAGTPLPRVAVGVGARWRMTDQVEDRGMTIERVTTYTVRELSDVGATLGVSITATAGSAELRDPDLPPGATATLKALSGEGEGEIVLDFTRVLPLKSSVSNTLSVEIEVQASGGTQALTTTSKVATRIEPAGD